MRVLVLCDDFYHPARVPRAGLAPLELDGTAFDWVENAADWPAERMAEYPLVILTKSNAVSAEDKSPWMDDVAQAAFVDYVRLGNGLLVVHSGTAGFMETLELRRLLGSVFDHHPAQCQVTIAPRGSHPITAGVVPFTVQDEHYFMTPMDPTNGVFLVTGSEHGEQPGGWTRLEGEGRVCVLTPGHNLEVWLQPGFQSLLRHAMDWCGKQI